MGKTIILREDSFLKLMHMMNEGATDASESGEIDTVAFPIMRRKIWSIEKDD